MIRPVAVMISALAGFSLPSIAAAQSSVSATSTTGTGSYVPPCGGMNACAATAVPTGPLIGVYPGGGQMGLTAAANAWLGRNVDYTLIYGGNASESDFLNSIGFELNADQYSGLNPAGVADSRTLSIPLIWSGATLAAAKAGTYNMDYANVAQQILNDIPDGGPPNQHVIYIRTGWEQNLAGEMPWSAVGVESDFIGAWRQFVKMFRSVDTNNRFQFVWCPNILGNDSYASTYPGDGYVDILALDFYYGTNIQTEDADPDAAFQEMLSNGLTSIAQMAKAHKKGLAFGEWGVNKDNFGAYIKDFYNYCVQNNCLYTVYWDSDASYEGELSDGSYPETGAMFRHLWNPATYPVEPIAAPANPTALSGNGQNTVSAAAVTSSSTPVTTYYLYKGAKSGAESTTPVASGSNPSFTDVQANGVAAYYRIGAGNSLSLGYLSTEVSAIPAAPNTTGLNDWMQITSTGYAYTSNTALVATSQSSPGISNVSFLALITPSTSGAAGSLIAGFPTGLTFSIDASNILHAYSEDYYTNRYYAASTAAVPFPAGGTTPEWVRVDMDMVNMVTTFYVMTVTSTALPSLTNKNWNQLGQVIADQTQNHNGFYDQVAEDFYVGQDGSGNSQLIGNIYDMAFYENGAIVARTHFDALAPATKSFKDAFGNVWSVVPSAVVH